MITNYKLPNRRTVNRISVWVTFILIFLIAPVSRAQTQKGLDIDGEAANDQSGWSISMPEANTLAIGAPQNGGNGTLSGHVRVYSWNGNAWQQKGSDIDGEAAYDFSGYSVNMPDSNTLAIAAIWNDGNGSSSGQVRIYSWNGSSWIQKGSDIYGEASGDEFGRSISMPDSNTVAVGAIGNDGNGILSGHAQVYSWNGNSWLQKGSDIDGEASGDESGWSISMPDSNTLAIGASGNDGNGNDAGHVRIYRWSGSIWMQKGLDIDGKFAGDRSGSSVSMPDSNIVAIGSLNIGGNGRVRIYSWNGSAWGQKGLDIDGEAPGDLFGCSVNMLDSNALAVGARYNDGNGTSAGHVRIFRWNGTSWGQVGPDIDGEAAGDLSGWSVSMPDSNTLAIGANYNDGNGSDAGHVRIYSINFITNFRKELLQSSIKIYPNPVRDYLSIEMKEFVQNTTVSIRNVNGQLVYENSNLREGNNQIDFSNWAKGVYFVRIIGDDFDQAVKVVRE